MQILIIEDNPDVLANLYDYLEARGHQVDSAMDGMTGVERATSQHFDAIILDVGLPKLNGFAVCQQIRQKSAEYIPILMLTARDNLDDKLTGFAQGADDYVLKPFALAELEARLQALVRRHKNAQKNLQVGSLCFDIAKIEITKDQITLNITPVQRKILEILMRASPNVVKREQLEYAIWGDEPPEKDILRAHIYALRTALGENAPILTTLKGVGYKLVA